MTANTQPSEPTRVPIAVDRYFPPPGYCKPDTAGWGTTEVAPWQQTLFQHVGVHFKVSEVVMEDDDDSATKRECITATCKGKRNLAKPTTNNTCSNVRADGHLIFQHGVHVGNPGLPSARGGFRGHPGGRVHASHVVGLKHSTDVCMRLHMRVGEVHPPNPKHAHVYTPCDVKEYTWLRGGVSADVYGNNNNKNELLLCVRRAGHPDVAAVVEALTQQHAIYTLASIPCNEVASSVEKRPYKYGFGFVCSSPSGRYQCFGSEPRLISHRETWPEARHFVRRVGRLVGAMWQAYARVLPHAAAKQRRAVGRYAYPASTGFNKWAVNYTTSAGHRDVHDYTDGYSILLIVHDGCVRGGHLVLPELRLVVPSEHASVVLMKAHKLTHGNLRASRAPGRHGRMSIVAFANRLVTQHNQLFG